MTDSKTPEWADVAARALDAMPPEGPQLRSHRIAFISQALLSAYERGRKEGIEKSANHLEGLAKATPLGHENVQRGRSTYNWLTHHATTIRQLLEVKLEG